MKRIKRSHIRKPLRALALAALALVLGTQAVLPQGLINFANTGPFVTPADRLVYDPVTCAPLVGTNWVAALYYGFDANSINNLAVRNLDDHSLLSAIARFRNVDTAISGTWSGGSRVLLDATIAQTLMMQVRVWDLGKFATFEDAKGMGGYALESTPFSYFVPGILDGLSLSMDNFRGITPPGCVPEPSVFALGVLGAGLVIAWQRIYTQTPRARQWIHSMIMCAQQRLKA